jgi:membrane-associated phospholipid phosphatase
VLAALPRATSAQENVASIGGSRATSASRRQVVWRDSITAFAYTRPQPLRAVTAVPKTLGIATRDAFRVRNVPAMVAIAASTAALIAADEPVLHESRRLAWHVGLPPNHPSANVRVGMFKMAFPTTVGSGLYFLGDGLTNVGVAAGFAARGALADDLRARRTASEVIEALLASGTVAQVLKHVAGRQTPSEATVPRGRWRPFASPRDYSANVPAYDAFPSGHLTTTMAMFTVMAENYPEHKFIWPVGMVTMGALSFAMVNNGVHWASDYPLALAIGGVVGKVVVARGRTVVHVPAGARDSTPAFEHSARVKIQPVVGPGFIGVQARW